MLFFPFHMFFFYPATLGWVLFVVDDQRTLLEGLAGCTAPAIASKRKRRGSPPQRGWESDKRVRPQMESRDVQRMKIMLSRETLSSTRRERSFEQCLTYG